MYEAKKFNSIREMDGFSEKMMSEHYKLYEGYVKKYNEITEKLQTVDKTTANATFSDLRALKLGLSFALDGIKSHELFFGHLGGNGGPASGAIEKLIADNFGSFENWMTDMKQTGIAARGWVWTAFDWDTHKVFNFLGDAHDAFPIWNATPLVALDVYEHAYFIDYGVKRADYVDAFFKNLDWEFVNKRITDHGIDKV